jgi:hypothetical protein
VAAAAEMPCMGSGCVARSDKTCASAMLSPATLACGPLLLTEPPADDSVAWQLLLAALLLVSASGKGAVGSSVAPGMLCCGSKVPCSGMPLY